MKDAFRKMRRFLMNGMPQRRLGDCADSAAVDFCVTQVVRRQLGLAAILSKRLFENAP